MTNDTNGRPYAKLSELKEGMYVEVDGGFDCIEAGSRLCVQQHPDGLWIKCTHGQHYLEGQLDFDDGDSLIGIYQAK